MSMSELARAANSLPTPSGDQVTRKLILDRLSLHNEIWFHDGDEYVRSLLGQERKAFLKEFNALDQQTDKALWSVVRPHGEHICTVILLHERGEFPQSLAQRLFESPIGRDLWCRTPGIKWVFPKAPASLNRFGNQPMWFANRDSPDYRQDIEQNAVYLNYIVEQEAKLLRDGTDMILLGGLQQGAAMAMHALLRRCTSVRGLISVGGWLDPEVIPKDTCKTRNTRITRYPTPVQHTPVFDLHDRIDEVVSTDKFQQMLAAIRACGPEVGHIETQANKLRKVRNSPMFGANQWETQIVKALSGLQKLPDKRQNNHLKGLGLHEVAKHLRYRPREARFGGLADLLVAPFANFRILEPLATRWDVCLPTWPA